MQATLLPPPGTANEITMHSPTTFSPGSRKTTTSSKATNCRVRFCPSCTVMLVLPNFANPPTTWMGGDGEVNCEVVIEENMYSAPSKAVAPMVKL